MSEPTALQPPAPDPGQEDSQAAAAAARGKRPADGASAEGATPAKRTRRSSEGSAVKRAGSRKKAAPEEPAEPAEPPGAFALFSRSKWPVLVGEPKDRLEQAKLMWRALPADSRSSFQSQAAELKARYDEAREAYARDYQAYRKALPPAARAELKQKEREAAQAEKARAKEQKEREKAFRATLKDMGDCLKGNLQIARFGPKRGGVWAVPDGQLRFKDIGYDLFSFIFGGFRRKFTPTGAAESTPVIGLQLNKAEAGGVFGVTKLRGGSMYAKFEVCSMSVTYRPQDRSLELGYRMGEYF